MMSEQKKYFFHLNFEARTFEEFIETEWPLWNTIFISWYIYLSILFTITKYHTVVARKSCNLLYFASWSFISMAVRTSFLLFMIAKKPSVLWEYSSFHVLWAFFESIYLNFTILRTFMFQLIIGLNPLSFLLLQLNHVRKGWTHIESWLLHCIL